MKKILPVLLIVVLLLASCSSTKEVAPAPVPEVTPVLPAETTSAAPRVGSFIVEGQLVAGGLAAVEIGDYVYAAGMGDLGYQVTSINQARANVMQSYAEFVNVAIQSVMQNYAQGGGIVNSSAEKDLQSVVNNAVGSQIVSRANISGIEYLDMQITDTEAVYVLSRVRKDKLNDYVKEESKSILRNDAAVKANTEASNFFNKLVTDGIF